jgi:hypothetical protein
VCAANGASNSRPETTARHELDLCIDLAKLTLSSANCCVGSYLSVCEPRQLLRPLAPHSMAVEGERVAVAAIGAGSVLAQSWQRSRQVIASLL